MKTVGEIVAGRSPVVARSDESVRVAVKRMVDGRIGALPVVDSDGRVAGMFTERDLMTRVVDAGRDPAATTLREVMTSTDLVTVDPAAGYQVAQARMRRAGCRHILVVEGDRLVGVAGIRDVIELDLSEKTDELKMLQAYVYYVPPELHEGS